jgi:hypothetical protein
VSNAARQILLSVVRYGEPPFVPLGSGQVDLALNLSMRGRDVLSHGFMIYFGRMSSEHFDGEDGIRRLVVVTGGSICGGKSRRRIVMAMIINLAMLIDAKIRNH